MKVSQKIHIYQVRTIYAKNDIDENEEDGSVLEQRAHRRVDAHWH